MSGDDIRTAHHVANRRTLDGDPWGHFLGLKGENDLVRVLGLSRSKYLRFPSNHGMLGSYCEVQR